jgi:hypothetical protein
MIRAVVVAGDWPARNRACARAAQADYDLVATTVGAATALAMLLGGEVDVVVAASMDDLPIEVADRWRPQPGQRTGVLQRRPQPV